VPRKYRRKGQHPFERAITEFISTFSTIPPPEDNPNANIDSTLPGARMTPQNLRRVLNNLVDRDAPYAYSWVLTIWFREHGIRFPKGFFRFDPWAPGSGGKTAESTRKLGAEAWDTQLKAKIEDWAALSAQLKDPKTMDAAKERLGLAFTEVLAQKDVLPIATLAQKLIPEEYKRNPRAARKRVETALKKELPNPQRVADALWLAHEPEFLLKVFLKGFL
jgi:hypothetical protein